LALHRILINSLEIAGFFQLVTPRILAGSRVILKNFPDSTAVIHGNDERLSDTF
jgi:hypothetical protein